MPRTLDGDKRSPQPADPQRRPKDFDEGLAEQLQRTNLAIERLLAQREADAQRGQPTEPRAPPEDDVSLRVYSVREVARILKISLSSAYAGVAEGRIPSIKIGARLLIPHMALLRLLEAETTEAAAPEVA